MLYCVKPPHPQPGLWTHAHTHTRECMRTRSERTYQYSVCNTWMQILMYSFPLADGGNVHAADWCCCHWVAHDTYTSYIYGARLHTFIQRVVFNRCKGFNVIALLFKTPPLFRLQLLRTGCHCFFLFFLCRHFLNLPRQCLPPCLFPPRAHLSSFSPIFPEFWGGYIFIKFRGWQWICQGSYAPLGAY